MPKSLTEVQSLMDYERLASFATVGFNNELHVVPVFFTYDDGKAYINRPEFSESSQSYKK